VTTRRAHAVRALLTALVLLPPAAILWIIWRHAVDVPVHDQWNIAITIVQALEGHLSLENLLLQANESRPVIPRLVFLGLARLTGWDTHAELLLAQAIVAFTLVTSWRLSRATVDVPRTWRLALMALTSALLFSPLQTQNHLWGIQAIVHVPLACLLCALAAMQAKPRHLVPILCCVVATYSYANGLALWVLVPFALVLLWRERLRLRHVVAWLAAAAASFAVYFHEYHRPSQHSGIVASLGTAVAAAKSFLLCLAVPFVYGPTEVEPGLVVGTAILIALTLALAWLARAPADLRRRAVVWLTMIASGLFAAALIVVGRLSFGVEYSLAPRYAAFTGPIAIGLAHVGALWAFSPAPGSARRRRAVILASALIAAGAVYSRAVVGAWPVYHLVQLEMQQSKAALWMFRVVPYEQIQPKVWFGSGEMIERLVARLDAAGMVRLPPVRRLADVPGDRTGTPGRGYFETARREGNGRFLVSGWCASADRLPCSGVVIEARTASETWTPCGMLFPNSQRPDVARALGTSLDWHGWGGEIGCPGGDAIRATALDVVSRRAHVLPLLTGAAFLDLP
jgi:hypothetical protein